MRGSAGYLIEVCFLNKNKTKSLWKNGYYLKKL